jgi:protein-L-isoaspartate(D-aspartate) O-methyltransferase
MNNDYHKIQKWWLIIFILYLQYIGQGATISAPHMHAAALEHLIDVIREDSHVLDVGSGSGYLATCFAKLIGPTGRVIGIDHIDKLGK